MCNNNQNESNCIAEILNVINILQHNASPENAVESCDKPTLGGGNSCLICNTRPVMLYTCCANGVPFSMPTSKDVMSCSNAEDLVRPDDTSSIFRVEKVDGNCCTFRVLAPNPDFSGRNRSPFISTNSFFTFDLKCCCAIRCLSDCFVDCI